MANEGPNAAFSDVDGGDWKAQFANLLDSLLGGKKRIVQIIYLSIIIAGLSVIYLLHHSSTDPLLQILLIGFLGMLLCFFLAFKWLLHRISEKKD